MKRQEIDELLIHLNEHLKKARETRTIVLCGGAAMILNDSKRHETQDVDMLRPNQDNLLESLSKEISKTFKALRPDWLNSSSAAFINDSLPTNWERRIVEKVNLSNLVVKILSNEDLLHSKICAHIDREMDEEDIKEIVGTDKKLFKTVSDSVLTINRFNNNASKIIIAELETRLGLND